MTQSMRPTATVAYCPATALWDHPLRRKAANDYLDFGKWNDLKETIDTFKPEVVIYLARKMPRLAEVLQWKFPDDVLVVSDFAIPWIVDEIRGKRVAIVDDTVNKGTTLEHVHRKVLSCDTPEKNICTFALARKEGADSNRLDFEIKFAIDSTLTQEEYIELEHKIARSICVLAKPYEVEFPIIYVKYATPHLRSFDILNSLEESAKDNPLFCAIHDTSADDTVELDLARITLDIFKNSKNNCKVRLYLDDANQCAMIMPVAIGYCSTPDDECTNIYVLFREMLSYLEVKSHDLVTIETFDGESRQRSKNYLDSLLFCLNILPELSHVFDINSITIEKSDILSLFGKKHAEAIANIKLSAIKKLLSPLVDDATTEFWEAVREGGPSHSLLLDVINVAQKQHIVTHGEVFDIFFKTLAIFAGEDDPKKYRLEGLSITGDDVIANPYLRLRVGPAFSDMIQVFSFLWGTICPDKYSQEQIRETVSVLLDNRIDDGSLVPVLSKTLQRVYRKGEAELFDRVSFYALHFLYGEVDVKKPDFPWEYSTKLLNKQDKKLFASIINSYYGNKSDNG